MFGFKRKPSLEDQIRAAFADPELVRMMTEIHEYIDVIDTKVDDLEASVERVNQFVAEHDANGGKSDECFLCLGRAVLADSEGRYDGSLGPIEVVSAKLAEINNN